MNSSSEQLKTRTKRNFSFSSKSRHCLFFVLLLLSFGSLHFLCKRATDNFSLLRIQTQVLYDPFLDCAPLSKEQEEEVSRILSQSFHYFSRGGQCFAFISEDEDYVIKFFRQPTFKWKITKNAKLQRKYQKYFTSAALAYRVLKDESALIWVHLNKTPLATKTLQIFDKLGIAHKVDLQNTIFVLQKKGVSSVEYLQALIKRNAIEQAKQGLAGMASLLIKRCEKGVYDEDAELYKNMGFLGDAPIFIDIGRFREMQTLKNLQERDANVTKTLNAFYLWMAKNHPELSAVLETTPSPI